MQHKSPAWSMKNRIIPKWRGSRLQVAVPSLKADRSSLSSLVFLVSLLPTHKESEHSSYFVVSFPWIFNTSVHSPTQLSPPSHPCFLLLGIKNMAYTPFLLKQLFLRVEAGLCKRLQQQTTNVDANMTKLWTTEESAKSVQNSPLRAKQ